MKIEILQRTVLITPEKDKDIFDIGVLSARIKDARAYESTEVPRHELRCSVENLIAFLVSKP